jgi:hypothetical protein
VIFFIEFFFVSDFVYSYIYIDGQNMKGKRLRNLESGRSG